MRKCNMILFANSKRIQRIREKTTLKNKRQPDEPYWEGKFSTKDIPTRTFMQSGCVVII